MNKVRRANGFFLSIIILQIMSPSFMIYWVKMMHIKNINLAFFLVINEVIFLLIPTIIYFIITKESVKDVLRFNRVKIGDLGRVILITIAFLPVAGFLSALTSLVVKNNVEKMLTIINPMPLYAMILIVAVTPAICEEITLRGIILSGYKKINIATAAIMNGLFFSMIHFSIQQSLYTFAMGIIVVYIVYYTNSIFTSMLFHFILNGLNVVVSKFSMQQPGYAQKAAEAKQIGIMQFVVWGLIAIICIIIIIHFIKSLRDSNMQRMQTVTQREDLINNNSEGIITYEKKNVITWHVIVAIICYIISVFLPFLN